MKNICLGTAMWGWAVDKNKAFSILDYYYEHGGRYVDTANNYPISGNAFDFQKSALFLAEWCGTRKVNDLKIVFKVGSVTNTNSPDIDLSYNNLTGQYAWAQEHYGKNLNCIMVHWDNEGKEEKIHETCQCLKMIHDDDIAIGLSGIKYPSHYKLPLINNQIDNIHIQVKHNFLLSSLSDYQALESLRPKIWAYGISVSGLKLSENAYGENSYVKLVRGKNFHNDIMTSSVRAKLLNLIDANDSIENIYHIAIAYSENEKALYGYMVAPSRLEQMQDIVRFRQATKFSELNLTPLYEN